MTEKLPPEKIKAWFKSAKRRLEQERNEDLTVVDLARLCGIPKETLDHYMTRGRTPSKKHIEKLADVFGYEVYALIGEEVPDAMLVDIRKGWPQLNDGSKRSLFDLFLRMLSNNQEEEKKDEHKKRPRLRESQR